VDEWWLGHHMIAIGSITLAWLVAGGAIEGPKHNHNAQTIVFLRDA